MQEYIQLYKIYMEFRIYFYNIAVNLLFFIKQRKKLHEHGATAEKKFRE